MNYLAHAYLSFNQPEWTTGNLISDFIKGRKKFELSPGIQQGIALHRAIDHFTDTHAATAEAKKIFQPVYRLYSGAFVDVLYDHFLANDALAFASEHQLSAFTHTVYSHLQQSFPNIPEALHPFFNRMQQQNWLFHYRHSQGIEKGFGGLVYRSKYLTDAAPAYKLFMQHYDLLGDCYRQFFPELQQFAKNHVEEYLTPDTEEPEN